MSRLGRRRAGRARRVLVFLAAACLGAAACTGARPAADDVSIDVTMAPSPPVVAAETIARVTVRDGAQQPVRGARVRIEGHMTHPGMAPVIGKGAERGDGVYEVPLRFTMHGDWILVVTGELPGGGRFERQVEVATARPSG